MSNVRKYLDLSTAHLPPEYRELIDGARDDGGSGPIPGCIVTPTHYGCWMWVPDEPTLPDNRPEGGWDQRLLKILVYARELGCNWILFDADDEEDEELPVFEDEEG